MKVLKSVEDVRGWVDGRSGPLGFVPTMGALHRGHISLMERAVSECERVIVSIFVNPTQFNDPTDFEAYPVSIEADLKAAEDAGVGAVFMPDVNQIYQDDRAFVLSENSISGEMEGRERPGHFSGVLTVVMKLLNIVCPQRAYFGEKDYQQFLLIQEMASAFFLNCEIVPCATVRADDGLALSSRNQRLSSSARSRAATLHRALCSGENVEAIKSQLTRAGFAVEYVEEHWGRRFAAAQLEGVRLIDNVKI